jgi:hypothetical protein
VAEGQSISDVLEQPPLSDQVEKIKDTRDTGSLQFHIGSCQFRKQFGKLIWKRLARLAPTRPSQQPIVTAYPIKSTPQRGCVYLGKTHGLRTGPGRLAGPAGAQPPQSSLLAASRQLALLEACSSRHTPWDSTQYAVRGTKYNVCSIRNVQYPARSIQYTQYTVSIRRTGHSVESKDACRMQHAECTYSAAVHTACSREYAVRRTQFGSTQQTVHSIQYTAYSEHSMQHSQCAVCRTQYTVSTAMARSEDPSATAGG